MPIIKLVTTSDLVENAKIPDILDALVKKVSTFESIKSSDVKAYHQLVANWVTGDHCQPGCAIITVEILSGRSTELLKAMTDGLWDTAKDQFLESLAADLVNLTFEIRLIEPSLFRK